MGPVRLNRRRFLGCSAAAGLALSQAKPIEGAAGGRTVRLAFVGVGSRGTTLLRAALDLPEASVVAVCDAEPKHAVRARGIVEKARRSRPEVLERLDQVLDRTDVDAVVAALPCDLHTPSYRDTLRAGKHLYAEKPLALTLSECDSLIDESASAPTVAVHVGFQRRSNPRHRDGVALIHRGDLGDLVEARIAWISSNGPVSGHGGWLATRVRSGDWMVEQGVHTWDLLHWIAGGPPARAFGLGRRDVFAAMQPGRDVTDHYSVLLEWPGGFQATVVHGWIDPADDAFTGNHQRVVGTDGGLDFSSGVATFRARGRPRQVLHPGQPADTRAALRAFLVAAAAEELPAPPVTLAEARAATLTGLLVRKAVDERRVVSLEEIQAEANACPRSG